MKPLVFRTLDGKPVVPSWLRHGSERVRPAPFSRVQADEVENSQNEPEPYPSQSDREAVREALRDSGMPPPPPMRRSSLPPRMSLAPPPVIITRPPPVPSGVEPPPAITPAEQEAYAHAALELGSLRARLLASTEAQLLELAVTIAEALIEREIEKAPEIHLAFARAAVAALGDTRAAKLRVSRAAYRAITEIHGEEAVDVDGVRVELTLDNSLEGLSVIAESGSSRVDGRVRERLGAVLRALEADHRRKGAEDEP
ncbi:MAG: hypothetical protein JWN04_5058 [Myxococcaceae bacterium]|nr:hypothetical protein [Myxococcaceae bacterium]